MCIRGLRPAGPLMTARIAIVAAVAFAGRRAPLATNASERQSAGMRLTNRAALGLLVVISSLWSAIVAVSLLQSVGATGVGDAGQDPAQLATLHWYDVNKTFADRPVGASPVGVAYDGANIWVANAGANNVSKLDAATGATI